MTDELDIIDGLYLLVKWDEKKGGIVWSETLDDTLVERHLKAGTGFNWVFWRVAGRHAKEILLKDLL